MNKLNIYNKKEKQFTVKIIGIDQRTHVILISVIG